MNWCHPSQVVTAHRRKKGLAQEDSTSADKALLHKVLHATTLKAVAHSNPPQKRRHAALRQSALLTATICSTKMAAV